jgi:hypothetical protein
MAVGSIAMWIAVPVGWLVLASRMQEGSSTPKLGPYLLVLVGIVVSMVVIGKLLAKLNRTYARVLGRRDGHRVQMPWQKSMRGERGSGHQTTVLDVVMISSVAIAGTAFGLWFFLFAGSSLPGA